MGVCHTDLIARDGEYPVPFPLVCGHEGAGVVIETGEQVTKVQPGDHVVMTFVSCGRCANCMRGRSPYCDVMFQANFGGTRLDGSTPLSCRGGSIYGEFMGQSSFATHSIVDERALVAVAKELPLETISPLGCSVQTGGGAVLNALRPEAGSSIAVFGAGAVGLCAVIAGALVGCAPIIAVDRRPERLSLASELGADHTIDARGDDPVDAVRQLSGGGVQYSLDATGDPAALRQAVDCLRETGLCGLVGAAPYGAEARLDMTTVLRGRSVRGVIEGDVDPDLLVPRLLDPHSAGRFPFDRLIRHYPFSQINEAAAASEEGDVLKPVLLVR